MLTNAKVCFLSIAILVALFAIPSQASAQFLGPNVTGSVNSLTPANGSSHSAGTINHSCAGTVTNNEEVITGAILFLTLEKWNGSAWVYEHSVNSGLTLINPGATIDLAGQAFSRSLSSGSYRISGQIDAYYVDLGGNTVGAGKTVDLKRNIFTVQ